MTRIKHKHLAWPVAAILALALLAGALAQDPAPEPAEPQAPPAAGGAEPPSPEGEGRSESAEARASRRAGDVVRFGAGFTVREGDTVDSLVLFTESATIAGRVDGDVAIIMGTLTVTESAVIDGDVVVVGSAKIEAGATLRGDFVVVGGELDAPEGFSTDGETVVVSSTGWHRRLGPTIRWVTEGLFWGRLLVPDLPLAWLWFGIAALLYLAVNAVFRGAVGSCAGALSARPLSTVLAGVLVILLAGPVSLLLAVSIVGLPVLPFLWFALLIAGLFGKVGVTRWIGQRIVPESPSASVLESTRSTALGLAVLCIAYMVPILGIATWSIAGVAGLGAAASSFFRTLRKEHPRPPERPAVLPPPASPVAPPPSEAAAEEPGKEQAGDPGGTAAIGPATPGASMEIAGFAPRLGALALDVTLLVFVCALVDAGWSLGFLAFLAYHVGLWAYISTTLGGIICHVRIVRADRTPLRFTDALVRGLTAIFSAAVVGLGWLWILWDPRRQSWHDRVARTYVVRVPADAELP